MRTRLVLAGLVAAAALAPLPTASAVCFDWYYQLTGHCNPCNTVGAVADRLPDDLEPGMNCVA